MSTSVFHTGSVMCVLTYQNYDQVAFANGGPSFLLPFFVWISFVEREVSNSVRREILGLSVEVVL